MEGLSKIEVLEFASGSFRQLAAATGNGVRPAAQSHTSTRAGGQDDVSSQANSLKLSQYGAYRPQEAF